MFNGVLSPNFEPHSKSSKASSKKLRLVIYLHKKIEIHESFDVKNKEEECSDHTISRKNKKCSIELKNISIGFETKNAWDLLFVQSGYLMYTRLLSNPNTSSEAKNYYCLSKDSVKNLDIVKLGGKIKDLLLNFLYYQITPNNTHQKWSFFILPSEKVLIDSEEKAAFLCFLNESGALFEVSFMKSNALKQNEIQILSQESESPGLLMI